MALLFVDKTTRLALGKADTMGENGTEDYHIAAAYKLLKADGQRLIESLEGVTFSDKCEHGASLVVMRDANTWQMKVKLAELHERESQKTERARLRDEDRRREKDFIQSVKNTARRKFMWIGVLLVLYGIVAMPAALKSILTIIQGMATS